MSNEPRPSDPNLEGDVDVDDDTTTGTPRRFKVIFHNDDYTTMDFVVMVLKDHFRKTDSEAIHLMLTIHKAGRAVVGVYTRDVAESKAKKVMDLAREHGMPLMLTTEPE